MDRLQRKAEMELVIFAVDVIERHIPHRKPGIAQSYWPEYSKDYPFPEEFVTQRPVPTGEEIELAMAFFDLLNDSPLHLNEKKCLMAFCIIQAKGFGSVLRECKKLHISRKTFYERRNKAIEILVRQKDWKKLKDRFEPIRIDYFQHLQRVKEAKSQK